jgi:predicted Zn-dependent protease
MMIGQLVDMKFGRADELEADKLGVRFMSDAGFDPRSMEKLMQILEQSSSGNRPPEFFSTHPNPENRIVRIREAIQEKYPNGVPEGLQPKLGSARGSRTGAGGGQTTGIPGRRPRRRTAGGRSSVRAIHAAGDEAAAPRRPSLPRSRPRAP